MPTLTSLTLSIGGLAFVIVYLGTTVIAGLVALWALFIAWGGYYANGANMESVKLTLGALIFGIVLACICCMLILSVPVGSVTVPFWVAVFVAVFVYSSKIELFSALPTTVNGFALVFAYVLQTEGMMDMAVLTAPSFTNPLVLLTASSVIGVVWGVLSNKLTGVLSSDKA